MRVFHRGSNITLPLNQKRDQEAEAAEVNMCTAKQIAKQARRGHVIFLAIVQPVEEEESVEKSIEGTDVEKMYHTEMPKEIKDVLQEYKDVFSSDLPSTVPPVRKGHKFKIELENDTPPAHQPIYKLCPLELDEAKKQIQYMTEKGFILPSDSPFFSHVESSCFS